MHTTVTDREGTKQKGLEHVCLKNGSNRGHILALSVLLVPTSLASEEREQPSRLDRDLTT